MINNRTLRDLLLPKKEHKETEDSQKINYAMKTIIRIIIFYLVESAILIKISEYQFKRNLNHMDLHGAPLPYQVIEELRNMMIIENMPITIITALVSIGILYYCNNKMAKA